LIELIINQDSLLLFYISCCYSPSEHILIVIQIHDKAEATDVIKDHCIYTI